MSGDRDPQGAQIKLGCSLVAMTGDCKSPLFRVRRFESVHPNNIVEIYDIQFYRLNKRYGLVAQLVEQDTHNVEVGGSYPSGSTLKIKIMIIGYYVICVIYCLYQLFKNLNSRYSNNPMGQSPELDTIMVVVMAWILAPVDVSLTWIRWYKEAEEARRRQDKIVL